MMSAMTLGERPGGEPDQLAELHAGHYRSLVRLASLLVDDPGTCEELVQDAFVSVWRQRFRVDDPAKLPAYLRSAVLNGARSHLRKVGVRRRHLAAAPGTAPSAETGALASEETRRIIDALRALPDRQREVLALRYYLDLSEAEIAATLGISAGSVKTHAHRGLAALAPALEER
jgi:RNA polymerase sigma-70 factor (sigma-E family)